MAYQESTSRREVRFYKLMLQLPLNRKSTSSVKKGTPNSIRPKVDFSNKM